MPPYNQFSTFRVLVVDDERMINKLVSDVLTSLGFRDITIANSGRKAIELVMLQKFDFIITDWRMADLDGIEVVRFIRQSTDSRNLTVPIIMLTGNSEAHYVLTAINTGANSYLIKPFSAEQLVKRIRNVIENPRQFVLAPGYKGPDRRHSQKGPPGNNERRSRIKK